MAIWGLASRLVYSRIRNKQDTTPQEQGGAISSILKWVSSNQNASLITSSLSSFPWLAYVIIGIEHEERERRTGLWKELLQQLQSQKGKTNVDSAIKVSLLFQVVFIAFWIWEVPAWIGLGKVRKVTKIQP